MIWFTAIMLLLFNGIGALYGGMQLISYPDGSAIGLDIKLLKDTPFTNYRVPGYILLTSNGIIDMSIFLVALFRLRYYQLFVVAQGIILIVWLIIQLMLIRTFDKMHVIMGATGMLMIVSGILLRSFKKVKQ